MEKTEKPKRGERIPEYPMSYSVECSACKSELAISDLMFARQVAGRQVTLRCKSCRADIEVDGVALEAQKAKVRSSPAQVARAVGSIPRPNGSGSVEVGLAKAAVAQLESPGLAKAVAVPPERLASARAAVAGFETAERRVGPPPLPQTPQGEPRGVRRATPPALPRVRPREACAESSSSAPARKSESEATVAVEGPSIEIRAMAPAPQPPDADDREPLTSWGPGEIPVRRSPRLGIVLAGFAVGVVGAWTLLVLRTDPTGSASAASSQLTTVRIEATPRDLAVTSEGRAATPPPPAKDPAAASPDSAAPPGATPESAAEVGIPEGVESAVLQHRLDLALRKARRCHLSGRATGTAQVIWEFGRDGRVSKARLKGEPLESAPVGVCILMHAREVRVPNYEGSPFTATREITLR